MADEKPAVLADGTKPKALGIATKQVILTELSQGAKNCKLVKKYRVSKWTISMIIINKDKIMSTSANSTDGGITWGCGGCDTEIVR